MILLECPETGERHLVRNAVGYKGWKLISRSAPRPEEGHCHWCSESETWVVDDAAQERASRLAAMRDPEKLLDMIDGLINEIAALKAVITGEAP